MNNLYRLLRYTALMAVMFFVSSGNIAWGQTGIWYIANDNSTNGHPGKVYSSATDAEKYYLVPARPKDSPQDSPKYRDVYYSPNHETENGDPEKPFLATHFITKPDLDAVWVVTPSSTSGYYNIIHVKTGKYVIHELPLPNEQNRRKAVHLQTPDNGTYGVSTNDYYNFAISGSGNYLISVKNPPSNYQAHIYWNPTGQNTGDEYWGNASPLYKNALVGLFSGTTENSIWHFENAKLAAPTISDVSASNTITITDANGLPAGYTIHYTTGDGTQDPPTATNGTPYTGPIIVEGHWTVKAVVVRYGVELTNVAEKPVSPVAVAVAAPTITDNHDGTISLSTTTEGATIYYTTNGDTPDNNNTEYANEPVSLGDATVIKAIAYKGSEHSNVTTGNRVAKPTIQNNGSNAISITSATDDATIYYTTDGNTPTTSSNEYTGPLTEGVSGVTINAIAVKENMISSAVGTGSVTLKCAKPVISKASDNTFTIACSYPTSGVTIYYNTGDGNQPDPTNASEEYHGEVTFNESALPFTVKAIAYADNYDPSAVEVLEITEVHDYSKEYLTFVVLSPGTIKWKALGSGATKTIEYKLNTENWTSITSTSAGVDIPVVVGDKVRFRGSNTTYCANNKNNYSGFEGGTATFDIEGNIMSLTAYDDFANATTLPSNWVFCSLFKNSLVISAENLILPALTLTADCYRAMFSLCSTLVTAPQLPATTLATECYWYMFEACGITTAPDLLAPALVSKCYGHMFVGCTNLNYIKCLATSGINNTNLESWVGKKNAETTLGVSATGTFVKDANTTWSEGTNGIPTNWIVADEGTILVAAPVISCDGEHVTITCATTGADIYYRLGTSGTYTQYTTAITINANTTVQAYGVLNGQVSITTTQNCEYVSSVPIEESNRSLETWTYNGNVITTPYSVNAIDGHSSSYAKGTFNFETSFTLRSVQPTYLWFQHADQSATIYVDNNLVEKHWGGYNAFFVDISNHVHKGTNHIKVALNNNEGSALAPYAGDFNFNATLGNVKLFTSPYLPSMSYGYDGFHITSTVSSDEATINVKTTIPTGATVVCTISGDNCNYTETKSSTGNELVFTTTITNPRLWEGTIDPYLYNVKVEIYHDNELYHRYERPYGLRFYEYVFNKTVNGNSYTGFLLNGQPYYLRGVCMHDDLEGKANALNDTDYTQEFNIITELGCNFLRLAHYPHPKEVYDKCDQLGIIVQTEAPWVNRSSTTETEAYWTHLERQCADMVNQHYNHPCIIFWGVGNEINTTYTKTDEGKNFVKSKIEGYRDTIRSLMPDALVGYTVSHGTQDGLGEFNNPAVDWIGQNIYVGWYVDKTSNNPTQRLTTAINNATAQNTPCAYSEYGCGGTQHCHSEYPGTTTTKGTSTPTNECNRHDIEYLMWLHEGHIAAIKNKPELLFTSQWQLFDIAVYNRHEGYTICLDGETTFDNNELKYLNNKGLVERDHKTKKDPFYLYKAWWNPTDKFVHICGKDYKKLTDRVIKCYTNDTTNNCNTLILFVNNVEIQTVTVDNNIAEFTARNFDPGDVIRVAGATKDDTFTFTSFSNDNVFTTNGNWDVNANWSGNAVPADGSDVVIMANATIPSGQTANADNIDLYGGSLTIADGGQLICNNNPIATVQKTITGYTIDQTNGADKADGWHFIASPIENGTNGTALSEVTNLLEGNYNLYRFNQSTVGAEWENQQVHDNDFTKLNSKHGYLYANQDTVTLEFTGPTKSALKADSLLLSYDGDVGDITKGWNLVGNPYVFNTYVNKDYYKINDDKNDLEPVSKTNPIAPCTGVLVQASGTDQYVKFTKEAPSTSSKGGIQMTLAQTVTNRGDSNVETLDKAIVSFNEDSQLGKFYFGTPNANIYMLENGQEFAIVSAQAQGEIPVSFNARENGTYTLTVNVEDVTMRYLHLIDNITGADIDLLSTPSYTFSALNDDYTSRFRLVFSANMNENDNENENFAFFSNGNLIVTGDGILQIFDVLGRNLFTQEITTDNCQLPTTNYKPGVYVLRLANGEHVKTQKIVVR